MMRLRIFALVALPLVLCPAGCGGDADPVTPDPRLATSLTIPDDSVVQGEFVNVVVTFSATTDENVELSFDHSQFVGFRIRDADGTVVLRFPRQAGGSPSELVVRPGWDVRVNLNVPTLRPAVGSAYDAMAWLNDQDRLQPGRYLIEAGIYGLEHLHPWGEGWFAVDAPTGSRR